MHVGHRHRGAQGRGVPPAREGRRPVRAGAPLIEFDLDFLATHAKSLLTQIVIANSERVTSWERASGLVVGGKGHALHGHVRRSGRRPPAADGGDDGHVASRRDSEPDGAARAARGGAREPGQGVRVGDQAPARRPAGQRAQRHGDHGARTWRTARRCRWSPAAPMRRRPWRSSPRCSPQGCGDEGCTPAPAPATTTVSPAAAPPPRRKSDDPNLLLGVSASPGLAVGEVFQLRRAEIDVAEAGSRRRRRAPAARRRDRGVGGTARRAARAAARQGRARQGRDLRRARGAAVRSRPARGRRVRHRQGQERRVRLEEGGHDPRRPARRPAQPAARPARQRPARRRPARAVACSPGADIRPAGVSAERRPHRRRPHARRTRRRWTARASWASARRAAAPRRTWRSSPARWAFPRWPASSRRRSSCRTGRLVILDGNKGTLRHARLAGGSRAHPRGAGARRAAPQGRTSRTRTSRPSRSTARASKSSPTSAALKDAAQVAELGGEGVGLLRSEFLFMERARRADAKTSSSRPTRAIAQAVGPRSPDHHPHARRRRRQAARVPADSRRRTTRSSASAACGSASTAPRSCARSSARSCAPAAFGKVSVMFPMIATLERAARREGDPRRGSRQPRRAAGARPASWWKCPPRRSWPRSSRARRTSSPSAPTTSRSTRWRWTAGIPKLAPQVDGLSPAVLHLIAHTVQRRRAAGGRARGRVRRHRQRSARRADPDRHRRGRAQRQPAGDPRRQGADPHAAARRVPAARRARPRRGFRGRRARARARSRRRTRRPPTARPDMPSFKNAFSLLQKIGKCMMLPVSVLPVAGILLGVGSANFSWLPASVSQVMAAVGQRDLREPAAALRHRRGHRPDGERRRRRAGGHRRATSSSSPRMGICAKLLRHRDRRPSWASRRSRPACSAGSSWG